MYNISLPLGHLYQAKIRKGKAIFLRGVKKYTKRTFGKYLPD
jgi:hypothetical protein